tara:strand:+ start:371 stop:952 length:582 start_codon:yes stop_codon:yes gene_type:complete
LKNINKKKILICIFFSLFLISEKLVAEENWKIDKNLSEIEMKLQIFPGDDILIDFRKFDGLLSYENNIFKSKLIVSLNISSIDFENLELKNFLLQDSFFYIKKFPIILFEVEDFDLKNEDYQSLIKINDINRLVKSDIYVSELTKDLIHFKIENTISRKNFNLSVKNNIDFLTDQKSILMDKIIIKMNLFFVK